MKRKLQTVKRIAECGFRIADLRESTQQIVMLNPFAPLRPGVKNLIHSRKGAKNRLTRFFQSAFRNLRVSFLVTLAEPFGCLPDAIAEQDDVS